MKFLRYLSGERILPAYQPETGPAIDISAFTPDIDAAFLAQQSWKSFPEWLAAHGAQCPPADLSQGLAPCIGNASKVICVGLNYAAHARETNATIPKEPILFMKSTTALTGAYGPVLLPPGSEKSDWEVELAVIIGKKATHVSESEAMACVAGYATMNDLSERSYQLERGGQWVKGKSYDTFGPLGPWFVTADEVPDPNELRLWLSVNGKVLQDSNTSDMIFKVAFLVHYISQFMTLLPGDIISTGTPFGVGLGFQPPVYLKAGDVMELEVEGLGRQRQEVRNRNII
jgi:2-keto-4-pentenoate hydratase/2-oxohepta-3-ene-1,7-dioic acid hydratase in catechol pathway